MRPYFCFLQITLFLFLENNLPLSVQALTDLELLYGGDLYAPDAESLQFHISKMETELLSLCFRLSYEYRQRAHLMQYIEACKDRLAAFATTA